ncbi:hypothetical protein AcV7_001464 [Taiwanofungus camphoratus]|nr:hypothetical protein AcV7_001464 [Antrodia cinnamomea]
MAPLSRPMVECQPRSGPAPSLAIAPGPVPGHALHTPDSIPPSTNAPSSLANASTRSLTCPLIYPASPSSFLSLTLPHSLPCPPPRPIGAHAPASDVLHCPRPSPTPNHQPPSETDPPRPIHVKRTRTPVSHFQFAPCAEPRLNCPRLREARSALARSQQLYTVNLRARAHVLSVAAAAVGSPVALRVPHRCCARRPSSEARCPRRLPPSATIGVLRSASRVRSQRAHAQRALPAQAHTTQRRGIRAALTPLPGLLPPSPAPHHALSTAPPAPSSRVAGAYLRAALTVTTRLLAHSSLLPEPPGPLNSHLDTTVTRDPFHTEHPPDPLPRSRTLAHPSHTAIPPLSNACPYACIRLGAHSIEAPRCPARHSTARPTSAHPYCPCSGGAAARARAFGSAGANPTRATRGVRDAGCGARDSGLGTVSSLGLHPGNRWKTRLWRDSKTPARRPASRVRTRVKSKQDYHIIHTGVQDHHAHADRGPKVTKEEPQGARFQPTLPIRRPSSLQACKPEA